MTSASLSFSSGRAAGRLGAEAVLEFGGKGSHGGAGKRQKEPTPEPLCSTWLSVLCIGEVGGQDLASPAPSHDPLPHSPKYRKASAARLACYVKEKESRGNGRKIHFKEFENFLCLVRKVGVLQVCFSLVHPGRHGAPMESGFDFAILYFNLHGRRM